MFLEIAIGAIGIGIVLMVGYVVVASVSNALPTPQITNLCVGRVGNAAYPDCTVAGGDDNTSALIDNRAYLDGVGSTQTTVFAGFGLVAVGIIVLAAFGLINIFK